MVLEEPRAGFDPATYCLQESLSVAHSPSDATQTVRSASTNIDWTSFNDWLHAQYSQNHARVMHRWAIQYHDAAFDAAKAAQLRAMTSDKRRYVMQSLSAISKFTGRYEEWQSVRKQAGLKWESRNPVRFIHSLLSQESNGAIDWLLQSAPKIAVQYRVPLVFAALSGVRAGEAVNSCGLISKLTKEGKLSEYYDEEQSMLHHYKYPKLFLRNTKNLYISFVSKELVKTVSSFEPTTINAVHMALKRNKCVPMQVKQLRKYFATMLRKHVEREMVDLLQGRVDGSVFVQHYYRPLLIELRDKVLTATKPLENELFVALAAFSNKYGIVKTS